jgi:hypothetical protein
MPKQLSKNKPGGKPISAAEFDRKFDAGEDISEYLDPSSARVFQPGEDETLDLTPQKVNVDFPAWVVSALDREASRLGIARQALIKVWIAERVSRSFSPSGV